MSSRAQPLPIGKARFADLSDAPVVMTMVTESISKNFRIDGIEQINYLIDTAVLSVVQLNPEGNVVGFIALKEYPLIPSVHPAAWEEYLWTKYKAIEMNARNSVFIHLLCWNPSYSRELVDAMLKTIFMHDPYIQFIAIVKSSRKYPMLMPGQSRSEASFRRVQAIERGVPGDQLPSLCIAERKDVSPRLRIRRAVEEDNDDIVPIIERHSKRLRDLYGDYYISELISRHPESDRVLLVCEHKELAVGVMVLNTQINYESLEECFELMPFAGLRHLDSTAFKHSTKEFDSNGSFISDVNNVTHTPAESPSFYLDTMSSALARGGNQTKEVTTPTEQQSERPSTVEPTSPHNMAAVNFLDMDEEEVEFDIVNIDPALLMIPAILTPADIYMKNILEGRQKEKSIDIEAKFPKKEKKKSTVGLPVVKPLEQIIRYSGTPNAFLLELFAIHPDYDERYGFDMLEVAFEFFPDREYCVLCLPSKHTSFPLLEHFTLVTPHCTKMRFINETLYVAHINSVRGALRVRPGEASDLVDLSEILEHSPKKSNLTELFETSLVMTTFESYVLLSENQPVGVIILQPLESGTSIRTQYDLEPEPRQPGADCAVLGSVMSPIMEPHGRWFMRDVIRQSRYNTVFWICQPIAKGDASPNRNMISLAEVMMPVRPRQSVPNISGNKNIDMIFKDIATPFSLWVLEKPLTSLPKVFVNSSIVVVGASRTGLSFIEALIMGPTAKYLTFTNLTLVSENGLPTVAECLKAADTCIPRCGRYTDRYLKSIPFCFYTDVMSAVMVNIDRKKKCINLKGGGVKYYDELVIACGEQFQHPDYMKESLEIVKELRKGKTCDRMLMDNPKYQPDKVPPLSDLPENVMLVNSIYQANVNLRKLLRLVCDDNEGLTPTNQIVVYGDCLEAYCCMAALLEIGVNPADIAFVEPFPSEDHGEMRVNCFNDETIDERVQQSLAKLGISIYRESRIADWRVHKSRVVSLRLMSPMHCVILPCFAVFYYGLKALDLNAFRAINESGLVYDGGLVVGPMFETNDPNIYGVGPCVKYSRRLYASRYLHRYYCSEDVGEALAQIFLRKLNPFVSAHPDFDECPSDLFPRFSDTLLADSIANLSSASRSNLGHHVNRRWQPVMKFASPIVQSCTLPGPLYYMKVRQPGADLPMEVQLYLPHRGHTLLTDKRNNYFRVQLNVLHCINAVTCLSRQSFSVEILSQLYGKHEAFFNHLLTRYQLNQIDDLYEFFTQPWMAAMYQETFSELLDDINHQEVGTIYDLVKSKYDMHHSKMSAVSSKHSGEPCGIPECGYGPEEAEKLGTFRSIVNKHIGDSKEMLPTVTAKAEDIPSECGQSAEIRAEAAGFWEAVGGENMVLAHIGRYLARNAVSNPHYATPRPDVYRNVM